MDNIKEIVIDQIDDPQNAMRSELNRDGLFELADNIKQNGLINPITVRPVGNRYEVVAGHRRFSACKIAGKVKIQCVVRELTDNDAFAVMAAENIERQDVDPVDEASFITEFMARTSLSVPEIAKKLRRSPMYVETRLAVGSMPDYMKDYIKRGELKLGAALALVQITDDNMRRVWCDMAARDGISVAQAEYWLHGWKVNQLPGGSQSDIPPEDYKPDAAPIVEFECAIDGKKYDARLFRTVMIYEGNLEMFNAIVDQLRIGDMASSIPPHGDGVKDEVVTEAREGGSPQGREE